jgi:hypothetical protein
VHNVRKMRKSSSSTDGAPAWAGDAHDPIFDVDSAALHSSYRSVILPQFDLPDLVAVNLVRTVDDS